MKKYLLSAAWMLLVGCSSKNADSVPATDGNEVFAAVEAKPNAKAMKFSPPVVEEDDNVSAPKEATKPTNQPKKIIYTAEVKYRVQDLKTSQANVKALVEKMGGYISTSNQRREYGNLETDLTIRIPVAKFDDFLNGSEKESIYTDFKNVSSDDVSEEFYDNELRLKSKKEAFEKYLQLLKQAKNVTEVMAVEEQLRVIREEIESKEGRQKYINNQVAFSTVTLTLYQVIATENAPDLPISSQIWEKFTDGLRSLLAFGIGIFYWLPFIAGAFGLYWIFRWWRKRRNRE